METKKVISELRYEKLVGDIRKLIEEGRQKAARAAQQELVVTYWQAGQRICEEHLTDNAGYMQAILEDLSEELDVDVSTLKRCIYFFQSYKSAPRGTFLSWTHYKSLLSLKNPEKRRWYEDLAKKENLLPKMLAKAIKNKRYEQYCESRGKETKAKKIKRPSEPTYVYKARVEKVIDGDTLLLHIDLGFQVLKEQRIRLAEIDTPPIDEPKGKEAYKFVLDQLARVPFVMIKTNKIDIYGRYVGHIFYSFKNERKEKVFAQGRYLNQELVDQGLARVL